jgi:DNA-binding transcriptional ArsR family regulator
LTRILPSAKVLDKRRAIVYYLVVMEPIGYRQLSSAHLDATFAALADPTRRAILARLASGDASVSELAEPFAMTQPAISKHLKVLERAGLISRGRDAQRRPRRLEAKPLAEATGWLENYRQFWEGRFQKLDALLDEIKTWENNKSARGELPAARATSDRASASRTGKSARRNPRRKGTRR